jgi:hypothetical protein
MGIANEWRLMPAYQLLRPVYESARDYWRGESLFSKIKIFLVVAVIIVASTYLLGYGINDAMNVTHR